ncbi:MAG: response regulator transcription factor [Acidimicrobiales bacterium]
MASVFIVEDDHQIRELAARALASAGHVVETEGTAMAALTRIVEIAPDVVVLDLGLPDLDGADLLRMIRAVSQVPVIVATARDEEREIVRLLDAGADEYVVKPYSGPELEARIRALLRRAGNGASRADDGVALRVGGLEVDQRARTVRLDGALVECNRKEFDLLAYLAGRVGEVVTRQELFAEVWRQPYGGADKTIDVHISWLRRKLGETAAEPRYIHTVRGVGIKLVDPV